jgi:uncharacterized protein YegP (UPF0339 family)
VQKIPPVLPSADQRAHAIRTVPHAPARTVPHAPPRTVPHAPSRSGPLKVAEIRRPSAPGKFEIVRVDGGRFRIRILDGNGAVLALSRTYPDIAAAVEGVEAVRECAATSHISDQTARPPGQEPAAPPLP